MIRCANEGVCIVVRCTTPSPNFCSCSWSWRQGEANVRHSKYPRPKFEWLLRYPKVLFLSLTHSLRPSPTCVWTSMWPCNISHTQVNLFSFFNSTHKQIKIGIANSKEATNNNPPWAIKLSSQSTAGVKL
jgi:hypothetical protein